MLSFFPEAWFRVVKSIVLYQGNRSSIEVKYYPKENILGLFWPVSNTIPPSKAEAIEQLLLALAIVTERGKLPLRLSSSQKSRMLEIISAVHKKCLGVVVCAA